MRDETRDPETAHADAAKLAAERDDARAESELLRERVGHLEGEREGLRNALATARKDLPTLEQAAEDLRRVARLVAQRDEAEAEADRLHELLRHLHANATSAAHADLIALSIDVRKPRREG